MVGDLPSTYHFKENNYLKINKKHYYQILFLMSIFHLIMLKRRYFTGYLRDSRELVLQLTL